MKIFYKRRALQHLQGIHSYISQDNPVAANDVVRAIAHSIGRLEVVPLSARPGPIGGTRLLAVPKLPYVVVHRVREDTVEIIAILHTRQKRRD
ncbi:MAG: type II toxin-antitoxin system RelE/ParE family toxin [Pseudorhodoplanes sp.]